MSFSEFENSKLENGSAAERKLFDRIEKQVRTHMNPAWSTVIAKLLILQTFAGFFLMGLCPQFGMRTFGHGYSSLFDVFMIFGHEVCTVLCGAFFMGGGFLLASFFLDLDSWNKVKKMPEIPIAALSLVTLFVFWTLGAHFHFLHIFLWIVGALAVGTLVLRPYRQYTAGQSA